MMLGGEEYFELFELGLKKWNKKTIESEHNVNVFFFDNRDDVIAVFTYPDDVAIDPQIAFAAAHTSSQIATSFALMENHLDKEEDIILKTTLSDAQLTRAKQFKTGGDDIGMVMKDYMLISPYGFYSASENELKL